MSSHNVKLDRLPDRTPVKLNVTVSPELHRDLQDYARAYAHTHGEDESIPALIPYMLEAFMGADTGFKRLQKKWLNGEASPPASRSRSSADANA